MFQQVHSRFVGWRTDRRTYGEMDSRSRHWLRICTRAKVGDNIDLDPGDRFWILDTACRLGRVTGNMSGIDCHVLEQIAAEGILRHHGRGYYTPIAKVTERELFRLKYPRWAAVRFGWHRAGRELIILLAAFAAIVGVIRLFVL